MARQDIVDTDGRAYARLGRLRAGSVVELDAGFDCIPSGVIRTVEADAAGLFVACECGRHGLDGQLTDAPGNDSLIGVYSAEAP